MRTVAIVTGKCILSARQLAEGFNKRTHGEWKADVFDVRKGQYPHNAYNSVFMYGCSEVLNAQHYINNAKATLICVDKRLTFNVFKEHNIPTVGYATRKKDVPDTWEIIAVRTKVDGRKAEDLDYYYEKDKLPDAGLYTEYFEHKYEYRIVVFKEKVVGRYYKAEAKGEWTFKSQPAKGFEQMDADAIRASKGLGIDYVGFDVVANTKHNYRFLEANSGPILTSEAEETILEYYLNKV